MIFKENSEQGWIVSITTIILGLALVSIGVRIRVSLYIGLVLFVVGIALLIGAYVAQRRAPVVREETAADIFSEDQELIVQVFEGQGLVPAVKKLRQTHPGLSLIDAVDAVKSWTQRQ